jgi:hypothetical protein
VRREKRRRPSARHRRPRRLRPRQRHRRARPLPSLPFRPRNRPSRPTRQHRHPRRPPRPSRCRRQPKHRHRNRQLQRPSQLLLRRLLPLHRSFRQSPSIPTRPSSRLQDGCRRVRRQPSMRRLRRLRGRRHRSPRLHRLRHRSPHRLRWKSRLPPLHRRLRLRRLLRPDRPIPTRPSSRLQDGYRRARQQRSTFRSRRPRKHRRRIPRLPSLRLPRLQPLRRRLLRHNPSQFPRLLSCRLSLSIRTRHSCRHPAGCRRGNRRRSICPLRSPPGRRRRDRRPWRHSSRLRLRCRPPAPWFSLNRQRRRQLRVRPGAQDVSTPTRRSSRRPVGRRPQQLRRPRPLSKPRQPRQLQPRHRPRNQPSLWLRHRCHPLLRRPFQRPLWFARR